MENVDPLTFDQGILLIKAIIWISLITLVVVPIACAISSSCRSFTWKPIRRKTSEQVENDTALRDLVAKATKLDRLEDNTRQ